MLGISCNLLNTVESEQQIVVWVQNDYKCTDCYPCGHMANWELQLTASAQHHEGVLYHISLAQQKIKIQNSKPDFY